MSLKNDPVSEGLLRVIAGSAVAGAALVEGKGQRDLVNSTKIPTDGAEEMAATLGIKLGPIDPHDKMFREATLPDGWKKVISKSSHYASYIVDDKGMRRGYIFYKAASYDRSANCYPLKDLENHEEAEAEAGKPYKPKTK